MSTRRLAAAPRKGSVAVGTAQDLRLIDKLTDDEVEVLMAALPALLHLAALDREEREGPKQ